MDDNTLDTNVRLWVNNDAGSTGTISGKAYLDDGTNHKAFIGAYRTDATTYTDELRGFMYVIHIYNSAIDSGDDSKYGNSGCACDGAKCTDDAIQCLRDWDFLEYAAGTSCDPSCTRGCVRGSDTCDSITCENGFTHCDLCYDRECTECSEYFVN